ncbi:MAG: glucose-6-phosphate isomerase [Myxococcales bacterium]|nr:glucose-6-phosphate isomerase [Myxococcales bacterium]
MAGIEIESGRARTEPELEAAVSGARERLGDALAELDGPPAAGFLSVPHRSDLLREVRRFVRARPADLTDVVQLGIGGSSLGARALCRALLAERHNQTVRRPGLRFHLPDNIDPDSLGELFEMLPPRRTLVHVVSKSGSTLETLAQLFALIESFRRRDGRGARALRGRLVVTTGASGALREFADQEGAARLTFPDDVAGRFSILTASGLLLPALLGVPVGRVLAGARAMEARCRAEPGGGIAGTLAALHHAHDTVRGRRIHVEWIYADALLPLGDWFRQLWAESLGKRGRGPTPVVARGTTDQHSQLQLYTEGPDDKLYTLVAAGRSTRRVRIGRDATLAAIAGRSLREVFEAEERGTLEALIEKRRPLIEIRLPRISPDSVGQLVGLQQLQTALAGALYEVDPFDQPGVEAGKRVALRILERGAG